jgi:hypothetical protein
MSRLERAAVSHSRAPFQRGVPGSRITVSKLIEVDGLGDMRTLIGVAPSVSRRVRKSILAFARALSSCLAVGAMRSARVLSATPWLVAACGADPGDPPKSLPDGGGTNSTDGLGGTGIEPEADAGEAEPVQEAGSEADGGNDASTEVTLVDAAAFDAIVEANVHAVCILQVIPSSCPDCATQNASDVPTCQKYVRCFIDNDCNPGTACGSNDGVCGVNTIGGGEAPYQAAVQTYDCSCP